MKEKHPFRLFGIFGYPLSHTLSPAMQEAAFEARGLKAYYLALELDPRQFRKTFSRPGRLILDGFNVTVPYKQTVMRYLDGVTPEARAIGAVNTVFKKSGRWTGANTDVNGFLASLYKEARFRPKGKKAVVFGAGGAARAVVYGLAKSGAKQITVVNRHAARARELVRDFKKLFPRCQYRFSSPAFASTNSLKDFQRIVVSKRKSMRTGTEASIKASDLVVNATSVGLKAKDPALVPASAIPAAGKKPKLFFDLIYHVPQTPFMKAAARKGHRVLGGLGMLLFQGAAAFEYWTGRKAPVAVMRRALEQALHSGKKA